MVASSFLFWNLGRLSPYGFNSVHGNQELGDRFDHVTHPADFQQGQKDNRSRPNGGSGQVLIAQQLEEIASTSPELIKKLYVNLFDENLDANQEDWRLLGIDEETANSVAGELKDIFNEIKQHEVSNFSVIKQSDKSIQISIPKLPPEEAARRVGQIQQMFGRLFGPKMTVGLTDLFLSRNLSISGGMVGRHRVVTISVASDDAVNNLGRKYEIRTQVLYAGVDPARALENIDNHSEDSGIALVESVPDRWAHFFGQSD